MSKEKNYLIFNNLRIKAANSKSLKFKVDIEDTKKGSNLNNKNKTKIIILIIINKSMIPSNRLKINKIKRRFNKL